jgi:hypothetical protein
MGPGGQLDGIVEFEAICFGSLRHIPSNPISGSLVFGAIAGCVILMEFSDCIHHERVHINSWLEDAIVNQEVAFMAKS